MLQIQYLGFWAKIFIEARLEKFINFASKIWPLVRDIEKYTYSVERRVNAGRIFTDPYFC